MKKMTLAWLAVLPAVFLLGYWLNGHLAVAPTASPGENAEESELQVLYWVAPMDPQYRRDKPGKSPMGMDLVPVYASEVTDSADAESIHISPAVENNLGVRTNAAEFRVLCGDRAGYGPCCIQRKPAEPYPRSYGGLDRKPGS